MLTLGLLMSGLNHPLLGAHLAISLTSTRYSPCGGQMPKIYPLPSPSRRLILPESALGLRDQPFDSWVVGPTTEMGRWGGKPVSSDGQPLWLSVQQGKKEPLVNERKLQVALSEPKFLAFIQITVFVLQYSPKPILGQE